MRKYILLFLIAFATLNFANAQKRASITFHKDGVTYQENSLVSLDGTIYKALSQTSDTPPNVNWEEVGSSEDITASNGLIKVGSDIKLGGSPITETTFIDSNTNQLRIGTLLSDGEGGFFWGKGFEINPTSVSLINGSSNVMLNSNYSSLMFNGRGIMIDNDIIRIDAGVITPRAIENVANEYRWRYNNGSPERWVTFDFQGSGFTGDTSFLFPTSGGRLVSSVNGVNPSADGNVTLPVSSSTGLEAIDEGNGTGWRLIGQDASKFSNIASGAIDFTSVAGYTGTDFGVGSDRGFSMGDGNKLLPTASNFGAHVAFGGENEVSGYYNLMAFGTRNIMTQGYSAAAIGYGHTVNLNNSVGQGFTSGTANTLNGYWSSAIGSGLISKWKGALVVGEGNIDSSESVTAADRPLFVVGNGEVSANSGNYGQTTSRSDAFKVRKNGEIEAHSYGEGNFTGTPTYDLQVDADGNIIETAISSGGSSHQIYTALVTQTGTLTPTRIVLENTLPNVPFFQRTGVGIYSIQLPSGGFTADKTTVIIQSTGEFPPNSGVPYLINARIQGSLIYINTYKDVGSGFVLTDDAMTSTTIEIKMFP